MKVKELIEKLRKYPQNMEVLFSDYTDDSTENFEWSEITDVEKITVEKKSIVSIFYTEKTLKLRAYDTRN